MYPLEKFARFDIGTSGHEEKGRCLRIEYLQVSNLPQSTRHIDEAVSDLFDWLDKKAKEDLSGVHNSC
ncbi:hypothetical protein Golax_005898 [Gossypium laxum]|uniref:Uncharacterized protein n=1 Tax=Gossypium laxum TaxID=34288 RepID=A0A7J9A258_9ROSI|nr:hypothetical protein [Gossypium laxum]